MYYPEASKQFKKSLEALRGKKVAVIGHVGPDGDCIGSQVALTTILNEMGIEAVAINGSAVPTNLKGISKDTPFLIGDEFKDGDYVAVTVDCADIKRLGGGLEAHFKDIELNIDHHISNKRFAKTNIVIDSSAAACEILAGLFLDNDIEISPYVANALFTGIATDTGQFRFEATTAKVFEIAKRLVEFGAQPAVVSHQLYDCEKIERISLLKEFLGTFKIELNGKVCIGNITDEMYKKTGAIKEHTEGFVDYTRSIDGVVIGALLEERADGFIKGSLRAKKSKYRVDLLAAEFNGGGHTCAAGLKVEGNLVDFYPKFLSAIEKHLNKIEE